MKLERDDLIINHMCKCYRNCIAIFYGQLNSLVLRLDVINFNFMYSYFLDIYLCFHSLVCGLIYVYCLNDLITHFISIIWIELKNQSQTVVQSNHHTLYKGSHRMQRMCQVGKSCVVNSQVLVTQELTQIYK